MTTSNTEELLDKIYNSLSPKPLKAGDDAYVDCREVRGDADIIHDMGKSLRRTEGNSCQLYSGYRGAGKTTELLRLKAYLEEKHNCFVVYFAADEQDISVQDTQYTDILLACTRHLLRNFRQADSSSIAMWLSERWEDLKDFLLQDLKTDGVQVGLQIQQFAKLTTTIRTEPAQRQKIREKVEAHTETLIEALNQFINDAKEKLPSDKSRIIIIADNLDRIVPIFRDNGRSNHEEIFLDRHEQLKSLDCNMIYTVPISMIYSKWATDLKDNYECIPQVLPSVMVEDRNGNRYEPGINKLKEAIKLRVNKYAPSLELESEIFESKAVLEQMCLMSGGYMRDLIQLAQEATNRVDDLPITSIAVQRAIDELRDIYRRAVEENSWRILARVHTVKNIGNDNIHRSLLFNRCLLEYRYFNLKGEKQTWYDVHPLIRNIPKFQEVLKDLND